MGIMLLVLGLVIMTVLAVKGVPILFASVASGIFVLATAGMDIVGGITTNYMTGFSNYIMNYFLMFVLGAIFGKICEISGASDSIAKAVVNKFGEKYVVLGIIIASAILGFGGVSLFVALFAIYPLAMSLFKRADIPRRLFPGTYIAGAATFAMTSPFTPSTQNIIPMAYLGTTLSSGMVPGLIGTVFCAVVVSIYMQWRVGYVKKKGEHFVPIAGEEFGSDDSKDLPPVIMALLPMIILIVALNAFGLSVVVALFVGVIAAIICYWKWMPHNMGEFWKQISGGAQNGIMSIANTAAVVGFGSIVTATPVFGTLAGTVENMAQTGNPFIMVAVSVALLAGISGSASGGLGIAVPIVADIFIPLGVNAEAIHRIAVISSSALDSLPHNGFVNTALQYTKTDHKTAYFDIFMVSVFITIIETAIVVLLFSVMG